MPTLSQNHRPVALLAGILAFLAAVAFAAPSVAQLNLTPPAATAGTGDNVGEWGATIQCMPPPDIRVGGDLLGGGGSDLTTPPIGSLWTVQVHTFTVDWRFSPTDLGRIETVMQRLVDAHANCRQVTRVVLTLVYRGDDGLNWRVQYEGTPVPGRPSSYSVRRVSASPA
jgi:hypothetical protein